MRRILPLFVVFLLAVDFRAAEPVKPTQPDPEVALAEQTLKDRNVAADGPALIAFFKARTLSPAQQAKLSAAIRSLADDDFDVREKATEELNAAGRLALVYLKEALTAKDAEVVGRARRCIETIEKADESTLIPAAARVLAAKNPDGATEALLACLPWLDDEYVQQALFEALAKTGLKGGSPTGPITAALKSKDGVARAAAAFVLGHGDAETRKKLTPLLADTDPRVRFNAASLLFRSGDRRATKALFALLTEGSMAMAWQTEDLLCRVAGEKAPAVSVGAGAEAERRKAREAWETWWAANGDKIDLAKVDWDDTALTGTIIAELGGRVMEVGPDKKARWEFAGTNSAIDARVLPGGHVLVAEHGGMRVTERDRKGNILWEHRTTSNPVSCQRLPNGNTLIATYQDMMEVTKDKKVLFNHRATTGMIYHAEKLRDGRYLYVTSGNTIVELDPTGKQTRTINTNAAGNTAGWASVELLPNGNFLVALYSNSKVSEIDPAGKEVSSFNVPSPGHASRLRNGNTLVASIEGRKIYEYSPKEKRFVWEVDSPGRPFHAWRR